MKPGFRRTIIAITLLFLRGVPSMAEETPEKIDVPAVQVSGISLDGTIDLIWINKPSLQLRRENGNVEDPKRVSRVNVARAGQWLLFSFIANEPDGIVAREGTHGAELWFDDAFGVELKAEQSLDVYVNPFGTVWCSRNGKADVDTIVNQQVQSAAQIQAGIWCTEVAIDLRLLGKDGAAPEKLEARVFRQRQQRGLVPYEVSSHQSILNLLAKPGGEIPVRLSTPQRFVEPATFEVVRSEVHADDAAWLKVPATTLRNENGAPPFDPAFQSTEARGTLNGDTLTLRVDCREAFPETINTAGKELWNQDELEIFLGPEGYGFLQLACNSKGDVAAVRGKTGGKNTKNIPVPDGIRVQAAANANGWTVTLSLPFESIRSVAPIPKALTYSAYPWRIQVIRNRPERKQLGQAAQTSVLAVTRSATAHCPQRFAVLHIADAGPIAPIAVPLEMPAPVLSADQRKDLKAPWLLEEWFSSRTKKFQQESEDAFAKIDSADAWKAHAAKVRERLMHAMFPSSDGKLPERTVLNDKIVYTHKGDGFRVDGLIFESRPGLPVAATIYSPDTPPVAGQLRPVLMMIPAHHTPRNSLDLQVVGMTLARNGAIALATESLGSGERSVSALWEHKSYQCNEIGTQLTLAGEELAGWTAWDISRAVDYLLTRGDIDPKRVGLMGGVAGGGDISALAAAIDERITVSIPFNFNTTQPFGGYWDPCRTYPGSQSGGFPPWMVDALFAPRCQIMAQEFVWDKECQDRYARFQKLYAWLGAEQNLAFVHGGEGTHATHFNSMHRIPVYKILNRWWGTSFPEKESDEYKRKMDEGMLECYTKPDGRNYLNALRAAGRLREPHEIARTLSSQRLEAAREQRAKSGHTLLDDLSKLLHDIAPSTVAESTVQSTRRDPWRGFNVDAVWLPAEVEAKLGLAMWLFSPKEDGARPLVLGVAQSGKARFLSERETEIERLLKSGVAVALLDVRGCGETSPGDSRYPEGPSVTLATVAWMQDDSLPARQLKDVRTALRYLATLKNVDRGRLALWGEGLTSPNDKVGLLFDETGFRQVSPSPKHMAEPLGGWLAMTAALYPIEVDGKSVRPRAVYVRGTLLSFASILERRYYYVPEDAIVPGLLNVADMSDIAAALQKDKIDVLAQDLRDGSNRSAEDTWPEESKGPFTEADGAIAALIRTLTK
jgi:dienelactone hydrolase